MLNVKYKIEKAALKQGLGYLKKNPEKNFEKIVHWLRKFDTENLYTPQYDAVEGFKFKL